MQERAPEPRVAILLSTFNGARFLREQLESLLAQSYPNWTLLWRDDGSSDVSAEIMQQFAGEIGADRCVRLQGPEQRLRPTGSFLLLLRSVQKWLGPDDIAAFADQDDVWLPEKLARGVAALGKVAVPGPALYSARQMLVDAELRPLGLSAGLRRPTGFPAALAQNVTTGCTIMMNREAAAVVAGSTPASATLHDWWCYLVVTAGGGTLLHDDEPVVLYRQHPNNTVGAPRMLSRRAMAALRRGPGVFMNVLREHVEALCAQPNLTNTAARTQVTAIDRALRGGLLGRLGVMRMKGLHRQTWQESALFWVWFLFG